jgi:enoyl-[acyl-carrier protein] reductase I
MARLADPLMPTGFCLLAITFSGADHLIAHYNLMGPVKAALESSMCYIAAERGPKPIRAHCLSPGPIRTPATSFIDHFDDLLSQAAVQSPDHHQLDIEDIGHLAAFLVSDAARRITDTVIPVDGGQRIIS